MGKQYSAEFKLEAVRRYEASGKSIVKRFEFIKTNRDKYRVAKLCTVATKFFKKSYIYISYKLQIVKLFLFIVDLSFLIFHFLSYLHYNKPFPYLYL